MIEARLQVHDEHRCDLGEGPIWHPLRQELFWFDIPAKRLFNRAGGATRHWQFDEFVSAGGWVDETRFLIAGQRSLFLFDIETGAREELCALEADNPMTRANDGRADPWGGFWIGTMGIQKEPGAGAIYRYYRGELRRLYAPLSIPNAMCFSPDGLFAFYTDTEQGIIWRQPLEEQHGWPKGDAEVYITFPKEDHRPDGAVIDKDGRFWCAHFNHGKVTAHDAQGRQVALLTAPATRLTCPGFGGPDMQTLFVTSASVWFTPEELAAQPDAGKLFTADPGVEGQQEHRVLL